MNKPLAHCAAIERLNLLATASLIGLILLCLAWELWLAPLRPGGSWLVLKTLPLLVPLFGIMRGQRYTYQWSSLLILLYIGEGALRAMTDHGASSTLAVTELVLASIFFAASVWYSRLTRRMHPTIVD
ncbi:MAG TPA: DUF2069 domain-containing protein [Rhodocyclaceae bacterium]|nr:DUF2069 domain-containing protein [Rhodocyclaceae bacterium]